MSVTLCELLDLETVGADSFIGTGPRYPWGGLYGGQIVAQALRAAAATVPEHFVVHSLRAYFIRRGDHEEPIGFEVDRIRDGSSFCTRRVVANQAVGAILNLEASFQVAEGGIEYQSSIIPVHTVDPSALENTSWSSLFERSFVPEADLVGESTSPHVAAWLRTTEDLGDDPLVHCCALAFLSDDLPTDAAVRVHPIGQEDEATLWKVLYSASLDHTIWFHRPLRADRWLLHDFSCRTFTSGRGLSEGRVFDVDGHHVATVAQEVLLRDARSRGTGRPS